VKKKNVFYAQSGGVTAVINASACGVIETARKHKNKLGRVYAGRNGILGALTEDMIDTTAESARTIAALRHTPGGAFGSARYKLKGLDKNRAEYERLIEVFKAHDIGYFFYNGGGDSMDTAHKVSQLGAELGYPIVCIGVPKTVDNDLPVTDTCPASARSRNTSPSRRARPRSTSRRWPAPRRVCSCSRSWAGTPGGSRRRRLAGEGPGRRPHVILFPGDPF
jgi:6-phosphofructokinase 1